MTDAPLKAPLSDDAPSSAVDSQPSKTDLALAHYDRAVSPVLARLSPGTLLTHEHAASIVAAIRNGIANMFRYLSGEMEDVESVGESLDMLAEQRTAARRGLTLEEHMAGKDPPATLDPDLPPAIEVDSATNVRAPLGPPPASPSPLSPAQPAVVTSASVSNDNEPVIEGASLQ